MRQTAVVLTTLLIGTLAAAQTAPNWSRGANNPASNKGYEFQVPDIDNVPDLHGNPSNARLVLFIGGNQFFVMPQLITGFEARHPELKGRIFYETLPPGILRSQIAADDTITLGNMTLQVHPDVYEAENRVLKEMAASGEVTNVIDYATNSLAIMVTAGNPKHIGGLKDLAASGMRLSMPNPQWEGIANTIGEALRKAGGEALMQAVYKAKVTDGSTKLTEIHHRQTPMRILGGQADAGVTWESEIKFQQKIGNPIAGVDIPATQNMTAIYAAGLLRNAPHAETARAWLEYLKTPEAQGYYHEYGFRSMDGKAN
jgi:ABC-type molybdate transport system substrate-binding protein